MRVLILGASGMLGHSLFTNLLMYKHDVYGTVRSNDNKHLKSFGDRVFYDVNLSMGHVDELESIIVKIKPDFIINCIGLIKQKKEAKFENKADIIFINSYLPHLLSEIAQRNNAKFIHFSTDCVFTGSKGYYDENDYADSRDAYGLTKFLGEVNNKNSLTIRTSIIGHELEGKISLIDWFLSQNSKEVNGYKNAVFSGLPTCYIAEVLNNFVLNKDISGLYHLSVDPIDKHTLLSLVARVYGKEINIIKDYALVVDKSLSSNKFTKDTGYNYRNWEELIELMLKDRNTNSIYENKKI